MDQVVVFSEDTPTRLIAELRPDVLVRGPECSGTVILGADLVLGWIGRVRCPDWLVRLATPC